LLSFLLILNDFLEILCVMIIFNRNYSQSELIEGNEGFLFGKTFSFLVCVWFLVVSIEHFLAAQSCLTL